MSIATATPVFSPSGRRLDGTTDLGPALRSEWMELRGNRSILRCFAFLAIVSVLLSALVGFVSVSDGAATENTAQAVAVFGIIAPNSLGQLLISILGALIVSGERGRSMTRRAVAASAFAFALATLIVSTMMYALMLAITLVMFSSNGPMLDMGDGRLWLTLLGGVINLTLAGLIGFAISAIIRGPIAALTATLGLLLVAPIALSIASAETRLAWLHNVTRILPSEAGIALTEYRIIAPDYGSSPREGYLTLDKGQSGLVVLVWVVLLLATAILAWRRRDT